MKRPPSLIAAMNDERFFGRWFRDPETWKNWRVVIKVLTGEALDERELELFRSCTGRETVPMTPVNELWLGAGRRSGKSFVVALVAIWTAVARDWTPLLSPGETASILILATDRSQCKTIFRYALALIKEVPTLAPLVLKETEEEIQLRNRVTISITTASFRGVRGRTVIAAILDECSFWRDDTSANPDREVLDAILPSMATIPNALLLCASSLYAKKGIMYESFKANYGNDESNAIFWRSATRVLNPSVPQSVIDKAMARDESSARAEYLSEWRQDVSAFVTTEAISACTPPGRLEIPPSGHQYVAFVDPSGGSSDAMTLAIGHLGDDGIATLDCVRERKPPFSPESVVDDFVQVMQSYGITRVVGDRFGGTFVRSHFENNGISYDLSTRSKNELYRDFLPLANSRRISLLDNQKLLTELLSLERRTARGGRDTIDHPRGGTDDLANSVAGALLLAHDGAGGGFGWTDAALQGLQELAYF